MEFKPSNKRGFRKHRKFNKGKQHGPATTNTKLDNGLYGFKTKEAGRMTSKQIGRAHV